jgi:hypothetical protein
MTTKDHQTFLVWDYSTTKKLNYGFTMKVIHRKTFMGSQGMVWNGGKRLDSTSFFGYKFKKGYRLSFQGHHNHTKLFQQLHNLGLNLK